MFLPIPLSKEEPKPPKQKTQGSVVFGPQLPPSNSQDQPD
jgi:hypothetical protein